MGWARESGIGYQTMHRIDSTKGPLSGSNETLEAIRKDLEAKGIYFLENGETVLAAGVALKLVN